MKGKHLAIGFLVALFSVVGLVFWFGATGERPDVVPSAAGDGQHTPASPTRTPPVEAATVTGSDGGVHE